MANQLVSLLDVTKRKGSDQAIGLIEDTLIYAPEMMVMAGRPINGTQYKTTHRTLPTVAFRKANDGSDTVKSTYSQELKECFIIDAQLQIDQAVVAGEGTGDGPEGSISDLRFDESKGVIQATYITVGNQMYYGTDANGFPGIATLTASLNAAKNSNPVVVGAGGTTASVQTSAYIVWENIRGAQFIWGKNAGIEFGSLPDWRLQQVLGVNGKPLTAWVNNLFGWIGFAVNQTNAVARIANINKATDAKPLTDALIAQALSYFPLAMLAEVNGNLNAGGPNKFGPGLKIFMNAQAAYSLQASRTATTDSNSVDKAQPYPGIVTHSNGVPIVITDSIVNTEAVVT